MKKEIIKYKKLLNEILDHQIANRGLGDDEFYRCFTYGRDAKGKPRFPSWVKKAKKMAKED